MIGQHHGGGKAGQLNGLLHWKPSDNQLVSQLGYVSYYSLNLYSNFTFLLNDPVNGDGIQQIDSRWYGGVGARYERQDNMFDVHTTSTRRFSSITPLGSRTSAVLGIRRPGAAPLGLGRLLSGHGLALRLWRWAVSCLATRSAPASADGLEDGAHVSGQAAAQKEPGPVHARPCRGQLDLQGLRDLGVRQPFHVARDECRANRLVVDGPFEAQVKGMQSAMRLWEVLALRGETMLMLPPPIYNLVELAALIGNRLRLIVGKKVTRHSQPAQLYRLGAGGAEPRSSVPLDVFSPVQLELPAASSGSLAKVVEGRVVAFEERAGVRTALVRFTGVDRERNRGSTRARGSRTVRPWSPSGAIRRGHAGGRARWSTRRAGSGGGRRSRSE